MNRIRIENVPGSTFDKRIFLNDIDISRFVRAINITLQAQKPDLVQLTLVGRLELPDELQAIVNTEMDGSEIYKKSVPRPERDHKHL